MRQLLWVWMLLMALAFVNDRCHCCLQEERSGLLEIKAWFSHAGGAGSFWLQGWDKEDLNCCKWMLVECDSTTNRVIKLDLASVNYDPLEDLYLNASLFLPFKELEILDLRGNQLVGGLKNQGFQGLASRLRKLKILNLSDNKLNDNILSSLSGFSTLESLDLSNNKFTGTIGFQGLASGSWKLKELRLNNNKFNDSILSSLSGFSTLKSLDLSNNKFTGTIDLGAFQGLASGLRKLEELTLSSNKFNDNILSFLSGFSTLESLDLSNNSFTGIIGLRGLRKLEVLYLESSDFKENILLESLGGLPSLKTLYASESKFEGKHFGKGLCNSTGLEEMYLKGSSLPASFLGNIGTTLKFLDLSEVHFHDTLPAQGVNPSIIGGFSGLCAFMGVAATFLSATLVKQLGILKAGAAGLVFQASLLSLAVAVYWSGSLSQQSPVLFFLGLIVLSRLGHMSYDVVGAQILQTGIPSSKVNLIGTTEVSVASLAESVMLGVAIIANDASHFGFLAMLSLLSVVGAAWMFCRLLLNPTDEQRSLFAVESNK